MHNILCIIILNVQDEAEWPHLEVLPSYGRGRDGPGGRFSSLIFGTNLTDVVVTGKCIMYREHFVFSDV